MGSEKPFKPVKKNKPELYSEIRELTNENAMLKKQLLEIAEPLDEESTILCTECPFCKHSVILQIGGGQFVRKCGKRIKCADFSPK